MDLRSLGQRFWPQFWRLFRPRFLQERGRGEARRTQSTRTPARLDPQRIEEWEARIAAAGITDEWAARLAPRLAEARQELGFGTAPALIRGAALAMAMQAENQAQVERSLRDVREVERLLGAFSGELAKLDEVLEVLAAYAQRMRPQKPNGSNGRLLH